jgi:F0F1-type ATP synthase assembly protein I
MPRRMPADLPGSKAFRPKRLQEGTGDGSSGGNAGWAIFGYLLSGMAAYGGIGWLIGHFTHHALLFPLGLLVGLAAAILLIVLKYGRS